jgi:hypothetical protein
MAKPKKTEVKESTFIEPNVKIEGHDNAFIQYVETDEPELTAVGYARVPGTNNYAAYTLTFKGDKIVKMTVDEPNLKRIAEDSAKTMFVNELMKDEV